MNITELRNFLSENQDQNILFVLPDNQVIPAHFHITEIGRVQRDFIDCGGQVRSVVNCLLQTWVADDKQHRLETTKLLNILNLAAPILKGADLPVEVEYEGELISQFPILSAEQTSIGVLFRLGTKHTDCLAKELCGITPAAPSVQKKSCRPNSGCC